MNTNLCSVRVRLFNWGWCNSGSRSADRSWSADSVTNLCKQSIEGVRVWTPPGLMLLERRYTTKDDICLDFAISVSFPCHISMHTFRGQADAKGMLSYVCRTYRYWLAWIIHKWPRKSGEPQCYQHSSEVWRIPSSKTTYWQNWLKYIKLSLLQSEF